MPCVNFCRLKQLMDMKNEYKETSPEMLAMRESVTYYMQLTDYIMQEPALLNRHDKLCRLIITIAEDYPDSIAENRGKVLRFPKVMAGPTFGGKQEPEFEVFVTMFSNNVPRALFCPNDTSPLHNRHPHKTARPICRRSN